MRLYPTAGMVLPATLLFGCADPDPGKITPDPRLNVVLVTLDTLRPDHIERVMPKLSAITAKGAHYPYTLASGAWTYHTMPTLLAGKTMMDMGTAPYVPSVRHVDDDENLLAEILAANGYRTFYSNANNMAGETVNLLQGYEEAEFAYTMDAHVKAMSGWLNTWEADGQQWPFFIHLHAMEPHSPWGRQLDDSCAAEVRALVTPCTEATGFDFLETDSNSANDVAGTWGPENGAVCAAGVQAAYDCALTRLDTDVARVALLLSESPAADRTVLVIAGDHGETLGPLHYGHNLGSQWDLTNTFMTFVGPGFVPSVSAAPVAQADLVPTLLDVLGVDAAGPTGRSLLVEGESDLRTFWCDEGGRKSFGWVAPDMSAYVRLDVPLSGNRIWSLSNPLVPRTEMLMDEASLPEAAYTALSEQEIVLAQHCLNASP